MLFAAAVEKANSDGVVLDARQISEFKAATKMLTNEAGADGQPLKPFSTDNDDAAIDALRGAMGSEKAFGFGDYLRDAATTVAGKARNLTSTGLVDLFRDNLNPSVGRFLGDIFVYMRSGASRTDIRKEITTALLEAWAEANAKSEPLIVIGHSLGGVILYDILSSPKASGLPDDFKVSILVTVGSQVGVFEEFKLYDASLSQFSSTAGNRVPALATVGSWMNVFDPVDLLSFRCEPIFEGVDDFSFSSATGLGSAHSAYFLRPSFFARLRERLDALSN